MLISMGCLILLCCSVNMYAQKRSHKFDQLEKSKRVIDTKNKRVRQGGQRNVQKEATPVTPSKTSEKLQLAGEKTTRTVSESEGTRDNAPASAKKGAAKVKKKVSQKLKKK